eukprot:CAMPEP_0185751634 /NCGR_PEP_ID=MMETSP1174-20130828/10414_1 /TAXON_ID=35687 /ORGANISM="Dictyocha speculum, Strain CCMP1381" /LENGTH=59 /DNA_ID=CAMNT_0028428701 /DNA_START=46 /DNA_END=226 /DNA_ORIENTATION=-
MACTGVALEDAWGGNPSGGGNIVQARELRKVGDGTSGGVHVDDNTAPKALVVATSVLSA